MANVSRGYGYGNHQQERWIVGRSHSEKYQLLARRGGRVANCHADYTLGFSNTADWKITVANK